jgi:hypothetical protein
MLQLQLLVIQAWLTAKQGVTERIKKTDWTNDRGDITPNMIMIGILCLAAVAAGAVIVSRIQGHVNKIPA